jgi:hypothetical protein
MKAAEKSGTAGEVRQRIKTMVGDVGPGGFVSQVLGRELGL